MGGEGEEEEQEEKKKKEEDVKDEARRWFSKAREKVEREDSGEALQRRGGTGEDAHRSSRARPSTHVRLPSCKDTERHRVVANWELSHVINLFAYIFIRSLFFFFFALRRRSPDGPY